MKGFTHIREHIRACSGDVHSPVVCQLAWGCRMTRATQILCTSQCPLLGTLQAVCRHRNVVQDLLPAFAQQYAIGKFLLETLIA